MAWKFSSGRFWGCLRGGQPLQKVLRGPLWGHGKQGHTPCPQKDQPAWGHFLFSRLILRHSTSNEPPRQKWHHLSASLSLPNALRRHFLRGFICIHRCLSFFPCLCIVLTVSGSLGLQTAAIDRPIKSFLSPPMQPGSAPGIKRSKCLNIYIFLSLFFAFVNKKNLAFTAQLIDKGITYWKAHTYILQIWKGERKKKEGLTDEWHLRKSAWSYHWNSLCCTQLSVFSICMTADMMQTRETFDHTSFSVRGGCWSRMEGVATIQAAVHIQFHHLY